MDQNNEHPFIDPDLHSGNKLYTTVDPNANNQNNQVGKQNTGNDTDPERYQWVKVIGQGTFGVVYKAKDTHTQKVVAIKKVFQDPNYRNREFGIAVELDHPNCVRVLNHYMTKSEENNKDTYLNLVMDFIPETLYRVLRYYVKMKMPFPDALGKIYAYQMFRSLAYIHAIGITHRDIKPQNILVNTADHRVVLCDFGSAKKLKPSETSVAYICSRYYRAPELILGEE
jgi:serine/threonine protein kinase